MQVKEEIYEPNIMEGVGKEVAYGALLLLVALAGVLYFVWKNR